ncbi:eukaryotic translation initiation factor 2-alpha kinase 1-like [Oppia nitens]|uniref:eukaryotic translation initiation factor 2-alpha kinase 1-like n=1 Tax=Oppia nitens TaxID=1686743 RepID=UPI0023DA8C94|nr:eukaryotic translation initiation factor 2-alpha kinase 1-like [Oppia nitens]
MLGKELLGSGSFGRVYKYKDKLNGDVYAIKDIIISDVKNKFLKEVNHLGKLQSIYVVKCYDIWTEKKRLYIQMELCTKSLKDLLEEKAIAFQRQPNQTFDSFEYFITSHLMLEMFECVEYLHTSQPPVIHRDLKPANILINDKPIDNRFLKLCDFGLATHHNRMGSQSDTHTNNVGTDKYMAPEVKSGNNYNEKSDIYSMGFILLDLFDINDNIDME